MDAEQIIAVLKRNEDALRARGVLHAALFGSRARRDNRTDSDTDIMIEMDPKADISVFDYAGLKEYISTLIGGHVDVVNRGALKLSMASAAATDTVFAF